MSFSCETIERREKRDRSEIVVVKVREMTGISHLSGFDPTRELLRSVVITRHDIDSLSARLAALATANSSRGVSNRNYTLSRSRCYR